MAEPVSGRDVVKQLVTLVIFVVEIDLPENAHPAMPLELEAGDAPVDGLPGIEPSRHIERVISVRPPDGQG